MDVYHLMRGAPAGTLDDVNGRIGAGRVRFATRLVGPWDAITIIEAEDGDFATVQEEILAIEAPKSDRPQDSTTAVATRFGLRAPRRSRPPARFEAFSLITVRDDALDETFEAVSEDNDEYRGSSVVDGIFDIMLAQGADDYESLRAAIDNARGIVAQHGRLQTCHSVAFT